MGAPDASADSLGTDSAAADVSVDAGVDNG
jgi:hypothetical protein